MLEGLRLLGLVSYAGYLWNFVIVMWLGGPEHIRDHTYEVLGIALTLVAAGLSWVLVERPAQRLKVRFARRGTDSR